MKKFKKILALALAAVMLLAMSTTAFATDADPTEPPAAVTTGSITVKNATKGHTYTAYKVFDATYDGTKVSYKTPAANASKLDNTLFGWSAADAEGNISVWALDTASEQNILTWVKNNYAQFGGTAISGTFDENNSTVTFSNLDFGYYYITSSLGTAVTIDTAAPTKDVYDKNEITPVDPSKTITAVDGKAVTGLTADAHVGSVVGFKITAKTTNWTGKESAAVIREAWTLTDTPTNMTIDSSSIVVKFNGTALDASAYTATVANGALTINVPMIDDKGNSVYAAPADGQIPIEITYNATIDAAAASAPAKNEIPGDNPPPPVVVYTYAFQVAKVDGDNQPLKGAQFELWSAKGATGDGAKLTFIDNGDGTYTYAETAPTGTTLVTTLDMTTNTTIVVKGLDNAWTYTLKEITVPKGYNQIADTTIAGSKLTKVEEITTTADGTTTTTIVDTTPESTALYKETVVNKAGAVLPSTGGMGTTVLYIVGGVVVAAAIVLLITKRRMRKEEY